ncbi:DUF924 family protein [Kordiimonas lacus]|uniref:Uncharacterized conserved protein, DUF924 family n=1 Tax=Kordiimonas lacus TaxID=637679 RepID=A0A1G7CQ74_9PROT|nr:DUF924 family protein [Kordiimonas lacus]SDE41502.1 Uncharacterized conserved protein, DUF924 family [Kordiimonas lacus]
MRPEDILYFWFTEAGEGAWWQKSKMFDDLVRRRFLPVYEVAVAGELDGWRASPRGRLAEIIVLDQFPRNMFRDTPQSFAADPLALVLSQEAVRAGADASLAPDECAFLLMPYMHSESRAVHEEAVRLFTRPGLENNLDFEMRHKAIIDRFGRYPHRNAILGRQSTPEELEFLKQPGSSF